MVEPFFVPEHVEKLKPFIQRTVSSLLDALATKDGSNGPVDLEKEFALPVPSYVSCTLRD
jgi:nitric oxide reductase